MLTELTNAEVDFETAVGDPSAYYPDPVSIVADTTLSRAQKQRFLAEWAQDLAQRQEADGEGMAPEDGQSAAADAALLKQVNAAISDVEGQPDTGLTGVRMLWRRLKALTD